MIFNPNIKSASRNLAYLPIIIVVNGMNEIHNKYNKFNHTNGTVKCFTLMNSWWYTQNAPTKIKQVAYLPIVGIMLIMNVSKLTAVWNWSSGNSIP